jgi:ankyrin repeat protein
MPIHWAAAYMDVDIVYMLLRRGAWQEDVTTLAYLCETSLHSALTYGREEPIIRALLEYGVPMNAVYEGGRTAFWYAMQACDDRTDVVELLIQYCACLDDAEAHLLSGAV